MKRLLIISCLIGAMCMELLSSGSAAEKLKLELGGLISELRSVAPSALTKEQKQKAINFMTTFNVAAEADRKSVAQATFGDSQHTLLHLLAAFNLLSVEDLRKFITDNNVDVNAKDEDGWTPLHFAAGKGYKEIVALLLNKGADVNAEDMDGQMPLHAAVRSGKKEIVELLLNKGADVNAKDEDGQMPLHSAASKEIVELLLNKGADVNAKDEDGWTPLHFAAGKGYKEIVELLLSKGADRSIKTGLGSLPKDLLPQNASEDLKKLLEPQSASTPQPGSNPQSAGAHLEALVKAFAAML